MKTSNQTVFANSSATKVSDQPTNAIRDRSIGLEPGPDGPDYLIGRNPRQMSVNELQALGHLPMSPLKALRSHCIDCCGGSLAEVRRCVSVFCPSWPFRMGENPWRAPASDARRESGRTLAERRRAAENRRQECSPGEDDEGAATPVAEADGDAVEERSDRSSDDTQAE